MTISTPNSTDIYVDLPDEHKDDRRRNIYIYSISIVALLVLTLTRSFSFFQMCLQASITLHDKLFRGIIRAKMYFYNTNPSGRILNRFSKDIDSIDVKLPFAMLDCLVVSALVIYISNSFLYSYRCGSVPRLPTNGLESPSSDKWEWSLI